MARTAALINMFRPGSKEFLKILNVQCILLLSVNYPLYVCIIPGKNFNEARNQKMTLTDRLGEIVFDFGLVLTFLRLFLRLRRFVPLEAGNQLPGCRLFFQTLQCMHPSMQLSM